MTHPIANLCRCKTAPWTDCGAHDDTEIELTEADIMDADEDTVVEVIPAGLLAGLLDDAIAWLPFGHPLIPRTWPEIEVTYTRRGTA
jgi:hypothetical protein